MSASPRSPRASKCNRFVIEDIVLKLFEIGAVKFGEFKLKSGIMSPIYLDLRTIVSYPSLLQKISDLMWDQVSHLDDALLCGVPYTALPIATCMSIKHGKPMLMRRKEVKNYGTKKMIEGTFEKDQQCLIVEDLVTSGTSVLETVNELHKVGVRVQSAVVLIDRQQGGKENLAQNGIDLYACYTIQRLLQILSKHNHIDAQTISRVNEFLEKHQHVAAQASTKQRKSVTLTGSRLSYEARQDLCTNRIARDMFAVMVKKQSNLCVSADVTTCQALLQLADNVGPFICLLKTHIDIITDFTPECVAQLQAIAQKHSFLIFEDRKFADIGNTVQSQFGQGIYQIASWAHIVNAHSVAGPGIIDGLKAASKRTARSNEQKQAQNDTGGGGGGGEAAVNHGLLLLAEMSSAGNLATNEYTQTTVEWAEKNCDFVIGFICRRKLSTMPTLINMTPGVHLEVSGDAMGQQYLTPTKVIKDNGSDIIIVGRGVYRAQNQAEAAKQYRDAAWKAYQDAIDISK